MTEADLSAICAEIVELDERVRAAMRDVGGDPGPALLREALRMTIRVAGAIADASLLSASEGIAMTDAEADAVLRLGSYVDQNIRDWAHL